MPAPAYFLFSIIPAGLLLWLGTVIGQQQPAEKAARRIFFFLLAVLALLQTAMLTLDPASPSSLWALAVTPIMTALIPIIYLHWRDTRSLRKDRITALLLLYLVGLALLGYGFYVTSHDSFHLLLIYGGGVALTLIWCAAQWRDWRRGLSWVAFGGLVVALCIKNFVYNGTLSTWASEVKNLFMIVSGIAAPVVLMTLMGRLLYAWATAPPLNWRRLIAGLGPTIILAALLIDYTAETAMLDWATDGLGIVIISLCLTVSAIAVALLLAWTLVRHRIRTAMLYAVMMAVSITILFAVTTRIDPRQVIVQRAEQINMAIQTYHTANGQYPPSLASLVPRYLLTIPNPMLFRDQTWCYEGGDDFYRLGYIHRPSFGVPAESITLHTHASAGKPPAKGWECDTVLVKYRERWTGDT